MPRQANLSRIEAQIREEVHDVLFHPWEAACRHD
jgi:hypothetical protein